MIPLISRVVLSPRGKTRIRRKQSNRVSTPGNRQGEGTKILGYGLSCTSRKASLNSRNETRRELSRLTGAFSSLASAKSESTLTCFCTDFRVAEPLWIFNVERDRVTPISRLVKAAFLVFRRPPILDFH